MGQSDMWSHKGQAKEIIREVVLGLLLLLSIWLILNQINPDILTLNALNNIPAAPQQSNAAGQATGAAANQNTGAIDINSIQNAVNANQLPDTTLQDCTVSGGQCQ